MKMTLNCLVAFGLATSIGLAQAGGTNCDQNTPCPPHGSGDGSLFSRLDTNGDGVISKAEFDAFNDAHFKNLDTNHDGKITPDELRAVQDRIPTGQGMGHSDVASHLDQRFYAADVNHDGGLDREEAKNMPMLSKYFDEVDANHDGKVTRQEYFDAMPLLHGVKKMDITGKSQSM